MLRGGGEVSRIAGWRGVGEGAYRVLVWQPERKEAWKTYRHGWEDNIKSILEIYRFEGGIMDWIDLPQDVERWQAAVKGVKKHRVPKIQEIS